MLCYQFWEDNKRKFFIELFPNQFHNLYELITNTHDKLHKDLTIGELKALYKVSYPNTTQVQWELLEKFIDDVPGELSEDVAKEVLQRAWIREQGRLISQVGIDIVNGKEVNFKKAGEIIQKINEGYIFDDLGILKEVSSELEDILEAINVTTKYSFNIPTLKLVASGIGPGIFCIVAARTEVGKTCFAVSLCAAPDGLAAQGALVHYYANEENPLRTQGRAVMSYTGMTLTELLIDPERVKRTYSNIKSNIKFFDCRGKSVYDIEQHIIKHHPDIGVIDQLDKLSIGGSFAREDERLGALYATTRDIGAQNNVGIIGLTQLNAEADGKTYISSVNLSNARTSKAAEGDLIIGIGKSPAHTEETRILNLIKNKITGKHEDVVCLIKPEISRFIA